MVPVGECSVFGGLGELVVDMSSSALTHRLFLGSLMECYENQGPAVTIAANMIRSMKHFCFTSKYDSRQDKIKQERLK